MKAILTIAIPTYNRAVNLQAQLERLLPQLTEETLCCVYDNASTDETPQVVKQFVARGVAYFRATYNGGIGRNFLRCFEECRTDWLWILSDDDPPLEGAVERILADVAARPDHLFLNYSNRMWTADRLTSFDTTGLNELAERMDKFHNFMFISSGVYNIAQLASGLRHANLFAYTLAPHTALVLSAVGEAGLVHFSASELVLWGKPDAANRWSMIPCSLGMMNLLNLPLRPMSDRAYLALSRKIGTHTMGGRAALANILHYFDDFADFEQARYTYHLIRAYRLNVASVTERLETWLLGWAFCHRRVFGWVRRLYLRRKTRDFRSPDRFARI